MDMPLDPKYGLFMDWAKQNGARFDSIELKQQRDSMRGIFATKDIKKDEEILFVPNEIILTIKRAKETDLGKLMNEKKLVPGGKILNSPSVDLMAV